MRIAWWNTMRQFVGYGIGILTIMITVNAVEAQSFMGLGDLPGGGFRSSAYGVSSDGTVVVGESVSAQGTEAFRWTAEGGVMEPLGDLPGGGFRSSARGVSGDGTVVVGYGWSASAVDEAFRWTVQGGVMEPLGNFPFPDWNDSLAFGVSGDGTVVVGENIHRDGEEAFRWTVKDGVVVIELLGDLPGFSDFYDSLAFGVSGDGTVVVGYGNPDHGREAFRWTVQRGVMEPLGDLPGGRFHSVAYGVSGDGTVVVGESVSAQGTEAFRWTVQRGVMEPLGDLPGGSFGSAASGVSGDGTVVVGFGTSAQGTEAFIWDAGHRMRRLYDVLTNEYGLDLTGWKLTSAQGISADGLTIVGQGLNPAGQQEAWIARLGGNVQLASLTLAPDPPIVVGGVTGPGGATGTVTLTGPAPAGGAEVTLDSKLRWPFSTIVNGEEVGEEGFIPRPEVAGVPDFILVPQGEVLKTFPITTHQFLFPLAVNISAYYPDESETKNDILTVMPPPISDTCDGYICTGPEADARVRAILDYFLQSNKENTIRQKVSKALIDTETIRPSANSGILETGQDVYLAAANHYLVGLNLCLDLNLSPPVGNLLVLVYEIGKPLLNAIRSHMFGTDPPSPQTVLAIIWGLRGVEDCISIRYPDPSGLVNVPTIDVQVLSPVNVLIHDPVGRMIGFDPSTNSIVNDFGSLASYSGPDTEPQIIHLKATLSGTYTVTGVGTGGGPYTIMITRRNADGTIEEAQTTTGVATLGMDITPLSMIVPVSDAPDDINGDGDVNRNDLNILLLDRGKTVSQSACGARCDLDGDGKITVLDGRRLSLLCTRPNCATQ